MTERGERGAHAAAGEEHGGTPEADAGAGASRSPAGGREEGLLPPDALADRVAAIASDRKAIDIRVLDVRGMVSYTDYFVICSGNTDRQARAIHEAVRQEMKDAHGMVPRRVEGDREARWILMDYLDCVVHIFTPDARSYYRLEQLWGEAPGRAVE